MNEGKQARTNADRKKKVLHAAAKMFLEKGYINSTVREIAQESGVEKTAMSRTFGSKENILAELVKYVLERQFTTTAELLEGKTEDKILFYAAETTLQLYMTELNENIRELYGIVYSMPGTSKIIQNMMTKKLEDIFGNHLPELETKDFYELEIASGGVMRGFMLVPCDMYFTIERKVARFLEASLLIYRVPEEKIKEAIAFVSRFNYSEIARQMVEQMLIRLESTI